MTRQTVLLVYGGESAEREASVRSARSVYAAMDGEKYDALLCFIDTHGKWWLLDRWTDNLDEHGGSQLVAALGSHSFLVLPGNSLVRPDVVMPVLADAADGDVVAGLARLLHIDVVAPMIDDSVLCRHLDGPRRRFERRDIMVAQRNDTPDDQLVVAMVGPTKEAEVSGVARVIESDSPDDTLRSLDDESLENRVRQLARDSYEALRCRHHALLTINRCGEVLYLAEVNTHPDLSATGTFLKLWRMSGRHYPEVIDLLIATARK